MEGCTNDPWPALSTQSIHEETVAQYFSLVTFEGRRRFYFFPKTPSLLRLWAGLIPSSTDMYRFQLPLVSPFNRSAPLPPACYSPSPTLNPSHGST